MLPLGIQDRAVPRILPVRHRSPARPLVDAEVIALAVRMLTASGLEGWTLRIGHVGLLRDVLAGLGLSAEVA